MGNNIHVLDLFSGIGGFSLGLERAGFHTVAFCEADAKCRKVLNKHWPTVPIYEDVRTLKGEHLHSRIDAICGGFPCQDISTAGKGTGIVGERSGLWSEYLRLIQETNPQYIVIENVPALRSKGLTLVLQNLSEVGYMGEFHCIPASFFGAPHQRDRLWIIAYPLQQRTQIPLEGELSAIQLLRSESEDWKVGTECWAPESRVCGVVDGFPGRMDRIRQLGNAVVPFIPYLIGKAILQHKETNK